jgi:hypothetical protein
MFITPFCPPYLKGEIEDGIATGFAVATMVDPPHSFDLVQDRSDSLPPGARES